MAIQVPTWTPTRTAQWAVERERWLEEYLESHQQQDPLAHEEGQHFRGWAARTFSLSVVMAERLWGERVKPSYKEGYSTALKLAADGWNAADIEDRLTKDGEAHQPAADPAAILDKQQEALALDMAAGRLTPEEWAQRYQRLALARLSLPGADAKTLLALLDRTIFANPGATAPRLMNADTASANTPEGFFAAMNQDDAS